MNEKLILQLENRLERLIEGAFTRLFSRGLSTHDIAVSLARSMEDNLRRTTVDEPVDFAPDVYIIRLNATIYQQMQERLPGLGNALSQYMTDMSTQSGYRLMNTPEVTLKPDETIAEDRVEVFAEHREASSEQTGVLPRVALPTDTQPPLNPYLVLNGEHNIPLNNVIVNVGRSDKNEIIIDDPHVSRHHLQLRRRNSTYIVFDVQSRSGTFVNNVRIREHILQSGDVIRLGSTLLTYIMDYNSDGLNPGTTAMMPRVD